MKGSSPPGPSGCLPPRAAASAPGWGSQLPQQPQRQQLSIDSTGREHTFTVDRIYSSEGAGRLVQEVVASGGRPVPMPETKLTKRPYSKAMTA